MTSYIKNTFLKEKTIDQYLDEISQNDMLTNNFSQGLTNFVYE